MLGFSIAAGEQLARPRCVPVFLDAWKSCPPILANSGFRSVVYACVFALERDAASKSSSCCIVGGRFLAAGPTASKSAAPDEHEHPG